MAVVRQESAKLAVARLGARDQRTQQARHQTKRSNGLLVRRIEPVELTLPIWEAPHVLEVPGVEGPPRAPSEATLPWRQRGRHADGFKEALAKLS